MPFLPTTSQGRGAVPRARSFTIGVKPAPYDVGVESGRRKPRSPVITTRACSLLLAVRTQERELAGGSSAYVPPGRLIISTISSAYGRRATMRA